MNSDFVFLASASPRRSALLRQIGVPFQLLEVAVDESVAAGEAPERYVARVAQAKADAGWQRIRTGGRSPGPLPGGPRPVLAADTAVIIDEDILGKPRDRDDATRMLGRLSNRTHAVLTAVTLVTEAGRASRLSRSEVTFRPISAAEARVYWDTGEPAGKAGAYAIQGRAAIFIAELRGSFSGVMGLPLYETAELLAAGGIPRWTRRRAPLKRAHP